jgi:hypothetical protein
VCNTSNAARTTGQANCNSPRYYLNTKRGLQRYMPPGAEAPFAVQIKGKWHLVHRAVTDAEFFTTHPDSPYRVTARRVFRREFFEVDVITRDGAVTGCADSYDLQGKFCQDGLFIQPADRRARVKAAVRALLNDPNRYHGAA